MNFAEFIKMGYDTKRVVASSFSIRIKNNEN